MDNRGIWEERTVWILGHKGWEVTKDWKELRNEQFHKVCGKASSEIRNHLLN